MCSPRSGRGPFRGRARRRHPSSYSSDGCTEETTLIPTREAPVSSPNEQLHAHDAQAGEGNAAWLRRCPLRNGVVLLGGTSLVDFRLRYAQSELRSDLTPSYWSLCGLVNDDGTIQTAPLQTTDIN